MLKEKCAKALDIIKAVAKSKSGADKKLPFSIFIALLSDLS